MNERRTIVVLLSVIAVALVMNVVVMGSRRAEAQGAAMGPVEPAVVSSELLHVDAGTYWVFRVWSDGAVDRTKVLYSGDCDMEMVCTSSVIPASCPGDSNHNGEVEFGDILNVLDGWGPCE